MGSMGRTESIFAGILLAAVIVAVLVVVLKNDAKPVDPSETFNNTEAEIGTPAVRFTGVDSEDLCICYEQAYAYGAKKGKSGITSDVYRGGYQACASRLPTPGPPPPPRRPWEIASRSSGSRGRASNSTTRSRAPARRLAPA